MLYYNRTATGVAQVIRKGKASRQILLERIVFTASAAGTVTISDGVSSYTFDVVQGINEEFCIGLVFTPDADVTITPTGPSLSVFAEYTYK